MRKKQVPCRKKTGRVINYERATLMAAWDAVKGGMTIYKASQLFGIPRQTLRDRKSGRVLFPDILGSGRQPALPKENEQKLIDHMRYLKSIGYWCSRKDITRLATDYSHYLGVLPSSRARTAGWFYRFNLRWPELKKVRERTTESNPVKCLKGVTQDELKNYYSELKKIMDKHELHDKPECIYYVDEAAIITEPDKELVIKGDKSVTNAKSASAQLTVIGCGNAAGSCLPPFLIFKGKKKNTELSKIYSEGTEVRMSETGWSNSLLMSDFVKNHFCKYAMGDNSSTGGDNSRKGDNSRVVDNPCMKSNSTRGDNSNMGNNSTMGSNSRKGDNSTVRGNSSVGDNSSMEDNSTMEDNSSNGDASRMGDSSRVESNATVEDTSILESNPTLRNNTAIEHNCTSEINGHSFTERNNTHMGRNSTMVDYSINGHNSLEGNNSSMGSNSNMGDNSCMESNTATGDTFKVESNSNMVVNSINGHNSVEGNNSSMGDNSGMESNSAIGDNFKVESNSNMGNNSTNGHNSIEADSFNMENTSRVERNCNMVDNPCMKSNSSRKHSSTDTNSEVKLLLYDGKTSHVNIGLIEWAQEHKIILFVLPPSMKNLIQISSTGGCFEEFRKILYEECEAFMIRNNTDSITRCDLGGIVCMVYPKALSPDNLTSTFRNAGIYPFDESVADLNRIAILQESNGHSVTITTSVDNSANPDIEINNSDVMLSDVSAINDDSSSPVVIRKSKKQKTVPSLKIRRIKTERNKTEILTCSSQSQISRKPVSESSSESDPTDEDDDEEVDDDVADDDKCCVCGQYEPEVMKFQSCLRMVNWAQCENCNHWVHLKFCTSQKAIRRHTHFLCPHCK